MYQIALKPKKCPLCISEGVYHLSYLIWKLQKRQIPALFLPTICYSKSKNIISHFWFDVNEQLAFNLNLESHKSRSKTDDVFLGLLSHCVALFCSLPWTHVPHASAPHIQVKYRRVSVAKYVAEYILRMRHLTITNRALSILGTRATMTKVQSHCPKKINGQACRLEWDWKYYWLSTDNHFSMGPYLSCSIEYVISRM